VDAAALRRIPNNGSKRCRDVQKRIKEAAHLAKLGWRVTNLGTGRMSLLFDTLAPQIELYDLISVRGGLREAKRFGIAC